jgi:hypothetical protein
MSSSGCKHYPDNPQDTQVPLQGSYVGLGNLDHASDTYNISLALTGPDSAGHYAGQIGYRSVLTDLATVLRDSTGDTLRFQYLRNNTAYSAWALFSTTGLQVHFVAPTGIDAFRLNREIGGFNMSGYWQGLMYSVNLQQQTGAAMSMDQEGSSFYGTLDANLFEHAEISFRSGGYNGSSFQMTGTMRISSSDYPVLVAGNYVTHDSIAGSWEAGSNGSYDRGTFAMGRRFQ